MTDEQQRVWPLRRIVPEVEATHWGDDQGEDEGRGCWASHDVCAIAEVTRLRQELASRTALADRLRGALVECSWALTRIQNVRVRDATHPLGVVSPLSGDHLLEPGSQREPERFADHILIACLRADNRARDVLEQLEADR